MTVWQAVVLALLVAILWGAFMQMVDQEKMVDVYQQEFEVVAKWVGKERASRMYQRAEGAVSVMLSPGDSEGRQAPAETTAELEMRITGNTMEDLIPVFAQAVFRVMVMGFILLFFSPLVIAAIVDGVTKRAVKKAQMHSESPRIYHLSKNILMGVMVGPIVIAALPISIAPQIGVVWAAVVVFTAWGMAQSIEQEI